MKKLLYILLILVSALLIGSCSTAEIRQAKMLTQAEIDAHNKDITGEDPEDPGDPGDPDDPGGDDPGGDDPGGDDPGGDDPGEERITDGSVYFVRPEAAGLKDGTSWGNAMDAAGLRELIAQKLGDGGTQDNDAAYAQADALDGVKIYLMAGKYVLADFEKKIVKLEWTQYSKPVEISIYGGYAATSTAIDLTQRNVAANETILSGDANGSNSVDQNDYRILILGNQVNLTLDGLTFAHAFVAGNGGALTLSAGGGDAIATLKDCTFRNNATDANSSGAAILVQKGKLTAQGCSFAENGAKNGSALSVSNANADVQMKDCSFTDNTSSNCGGVLNLSHGKVLFEGCTFKGNKASGYAGGALHTNGSGSELICKECTFESNESYGHGGAVSLEEGIVRLTGCTLKNNKSSQSYQNSASNGGGAIAMLKANGQVHLSDCDLTGNVTYGTGGAIFLSQGRLYIDKCRIAGTNANNRAALRLNNGLCYINRSSITGTMVPGDWGVAIQATNLGALCMNNVTITENTGKNDKDPSVNGTANYLIVNSTLADHSTMAGLRIEGEKKAVLINSILVNTLSSAPAVLFAGPADVTSLGSCIVGPVSGADGSTKVYTPGTGDKSDAAYGDLSMAWDASKHVCTWAGTLEGHTPMVTAGIADLVKTAMPISVSGSVTVDGSSQTVFTVSDVGDDFHSWVTGIDGNGFAVDALGNSRGSSATCGAWQAQ